MRNANAPTQDLSRSNPTRKGGGPEKPRGVSPKIAESDRLHWNCEQVVHQPDFLLDERFAVFYSSEQPIEASHRGDALVDLRFAREESASRRLVLVLRAVGH